MLTKELLSLLKPVSDFLITMHTIVVLGSNNAEQKLALYRDQLKSLVADLIALVPNDLPYGPKLFGAFCRMMPIIAFEAVVFRKGEGGELEVYLTQRPLGEPAYPGQFHSPGSAVRNGEDIWAVGQRLGAGEFGVGIKQIRILWRAGFWYQEARGWAFSIPVLVELEGEPRDGKWYSVNALPEATVEHHRYQILPPAVRAFKRKDLLDAGDFLVRVALGQEAVDQYGFAVDEDSARDAIAAALSLKKSKTPMGPRMYDAMTPHMTNIAAEGVAFRQRQDGVVEVLLEQRPEDDKWFSKQWAGLGVGFRNTDTGRESALKRLVAKEFQTPTEFVFVGDVYPENTGRGWYECKVFLAFPQGEPENGQWFPVDALPEDIVSGHRDVIIPFALGEFKKQINQNFGWSANKEEN